MSTSNHPVLSLKQAHQFLKQFDCPTPAKGIGEEANTADLQGNQLYTRRALLLVAHQSDYQIFGVCADSLGQGYAALERYANALGYESKLSFTPITGAVYLKFNPKSGLCYADQYMGDRRGVLISCQSADMNGLNEIYGHLPLDLFD